MKDNIVFEVHTPLGFTVRLTRATWNLITSIKHPIMSNREVDVKQTVESPDEIRQSKRDQSVFLFYRTLQTKKWVCVVVKRTDGEGFIVTTYFTNAIKEGEKIWSR